MSSFGYSFPQEGQLPIPVVDLFAGPGGLGEGFSRYPLEGRKYFKIRVSVEKDADAHKTLTLRAFFRQFDDSSVPDDYYSYLRGEISREALFEAYPLEARAATGEALRLTLGKDDPSEVIEQRIRGHKHWVLIGGPPCQAYSLVGRAKILGGIKKEEYETQEEYEQRRNALFSQDHRHQLYKEYLAIIARHWPSVFIMENVRGILSSEFRGRPIFPQILKDLSDPTSVVGNSRSSFKYRIFSLTTPSDGSIGSLEPAQFLIRSEIFGVPQARHRVILVGVREDLGLSKIPLLKQKPPRTVRDVIGDLPVLTSGLSSAWNQTPYDALQRIRSIHLIDSVNGSLFESQVQDAVTAALEEAVRCECRGGRFLPWKSGWTDPWYSDSRIGGVCNHETRTHMRQDLWRYLYAACFAQVNGLSPQLRDFPKELLPDHRNVLQAIAGGKFGDRFRVQVADRPSTTITSHISKDGHYFIHYDPKQYRSLTVREAARLQTFPDNYLFEGARTAQYHQVGNAVPPMLAYQVAEVVAGIIEGVNRG